jgi:hypothetical protein
MNRTLAACYMILVHLVIGMEQVVFGQDCGECTAVADYADIHYPPTLSCTQLEARSPAPFSPGDRYCIYSLHGSVASSSIVNESETAHALVLWGEAVYDAQKQVILADGSEITSDEFATLVFLPLLKSPIPEGESVWAEVVESSFYENAKELGSCAEAYFTMQTIQHSFNDWSCAADEETNGRLAISTTLDLHSMQLIMPQRP